MRPLFTLFNPLYRGNDQTLFVKAIALLNKAFPLNVEGSHAYAADELITWFKTLGFLEDEEFIKACEPYKASGFIRAKLWRVYTYCWAVKSSAQNFRDSIFIDLGSYDGKTVHIAQRYVPGRQWLVFDKFEGEKEKHGKGLKEEVEARLGPATVVSGELPDSLRASGKAPIGFVHVDLNDGEVEVQCLERLWDRIDAHAIILLDDYGWSKYRASQEAHNRFFKSKGQTVLELPTGQGLCIKR